MQIVNKTRVVRGGEAPYDRDMRRKSNKYRRCNVSIAIEIPSVNYHLWKACNMRCRHCFATFQDIELQILPKGHLGREDCVLVVEALAESGFQKINFAGGEPTLCPWLPNLIRRAKELGLTTSVVTNGSRITEEWLESVSNSASNSYSDATRIHTHRALLDRCVFSDLLGLDEETCFGMRWLATKWCPEPLATGERPAPGDARLIS